MSPNSTKTSVLHIALLATLTISFGLCCTDLEWTCMSGECIQWGEMCDGIENCKDASDETAQLCFPRQCPTFAFRCAYGACVIGTAKCNGISQCADDSDEMSCQQVTVTESTDYDYELELKQSDPPTNVQCLHDQFECKSDGKCISLGDACDGTPNCPDRSDEDVSTCAANECQAFAFRCNYGACINVNKICNGQWDCIDGSDEINGLCFEEESSPNSTTMPTLDSLLASSNKTYTSPNPDYSSTNPDRTSSNPTDSSSNSTDSSSNPTDSSSNPDQASSNPTNSSPNPTPSSSYPSSSGCKAPSIPNIRLVNVNNNSRIIPPGENVPHGTTINYKCKRGYTHIGTAHNACLNSEWIVEPNPTCIKYCPAHVITDGVTFEAVCQKDGITVSCVDRITPGTVAQIICATGYRKPNWNPIDHLRCGDDGEWDYQPFRCEQICGEEMFGIPDRMTRNQTHVPWHVGIYKNFFGTYSHICSGTVISAKVIISAAYCFWNNERQTLYDRTQLVVGAGKYVLDYYTHELNAEFQNISAIHIHPEFKTEINYSKSDVAVLVLTNFLRFSTFIGPVCMNWHGLNDQYAIEGTISGQIAGWNIKESGKLQTAIVPTRSNHVCKDEFTSQWADSVTNDKFCVSNRCNKSVCQADNGGGFTVTVNNRHYLRGVVSAGKPLQMDLEFVIYTNITHYQGIIMDIMFSNRPK